MLALGLSGIIALVISALLQLAAANYRQQQDQQRLSSALTSSWSTLGYYAELAETWAPTSSNDDSWRVDYQRSAASSRSGADCALHESSYSVGATLSNTFYIDSEDDAWHLHCDAYSEQKLVPDIANARLLYGVDLGSWAGTSFAYGAYDQQADLYLSAADVDSSPAHSQRQSRLTRRTANLASANTEPNPRIPRRRPRALRRQRQRAAPTRRHELCLAQRPALGSAASRYYWFYSLTPYWSPPCSRAGNCSKTARQQPIAARSLPAAPRPAIAHQRRAQSTRDLTTRQHQRLPRRRRHLATSLLGS